MKFLTHLFALLITLLLLIPPLAYGDQLTDLQNSTVVVKTPTGHGSGFLFTRTTESGKAVQLIWTAAHVVEKIRENRGPCPLITIIQEDRIGLAKILRYGDSQNGPDCAVLLVIVGNFPNSDLEFFKHQSIKVGQDITHCGTPYSLEDNKQIVTFGTIAFVGRSFRWDDTSRKRIFDQCDINAGPGSSGGPVCDKQTGKILGLVIIRTGPHLVFIEKADSI